MTNTTSETNAANRRSVPLPERSSTALWVIAGAVIVLTVIGFMVWGGSSTPVTTTTVPQVENNVTVAPPLPAPSTTTTMDAQPPVEAPAATTIAPAPAETAPAPAPVQQPAANP